jgi:hypothetical protein
MDWDVAWIEAMINAHILVRNLQGNDEVLAGYEPSGNKYKGLRASEVAPCPCSCLQFTR